MSCKEALEVLKKELAAKNALGRYYSHETDLMKSYASCAASVCHVHCEYLGMLLKTMLKKEDDKARESYLLFVEACFDAPKFNVELFNRVKQHCELPGLLKCYVAVHKEMLQTIFTLEPLLPSHAMDGMRRLCASIPIDWNRVQKIKAPDMKKETVGMEDIRKAITPDLLKKLSDFMAICELIKKVCLGPPPRTTTTPLQAVGADTSQENENSTSCSIQ